MNRTIIIKLHFAIILVLLTSITKANNDIQKIERYHKSFIPTLIFSNEIWYDDAVSNSDIIVMPHAELVIKGKLCMHPETKIIVKSGAKLIIDGGYITTKKFSRRQWQGIKVLGRREYHQFLCDGEYEQGYIELKNNAIIENAIVGISLFDYELVNSFGGIIHAENSRFINNTKSIYTMNYDNYDPNTSIFAKYNAFFNNCVFEINKNYLGSEIFYKHVDLDRINGISFNGCDFIIKDYNNQTMSYYNMAIASYNSTFTVGALRKSNNLQYNDSEYDRSSFSGFFKAIGAEQNDDINRNIIVTMTDFYDNSYGVNILNIAYCTIAHSNFKTRKIFIEETAGVYLSNIREAVIDDNYFTFNNNEEDNICYGIFLLDSYIENVYNNTFHGVIDTNHEYVDIADQYNSSIGLLKTFEDGTQGIVFYDNRDGHGLVVSLVDTVLQWGGYNIDIEENINDEIFDSEFVPLSGKSKTEAITKNLKEREYVYAAEWCQQLGDGWYLPSSNEICRLVEMANKHKLGKKSSINKALVKHGGKPMILDSYWSSSEVDRGNAYLMEYTSKHRMFKFFLARVRAVREF